jgi:Fe-S cluster biosynthesis and repair protein YggX
MAQRMVKCVRLHKELPGLDEAPWPGELGQRIYENVSQEAWKEWTSHLRMLINEYRLVLANKEAQDFVAAQMEQFFFGAGAGEIPNYVPIK